LFVHSFLKLSKIGISENLRFLVFRRIEAEQENIRAKTIEIMLMACSSGAENHQGEDGEQDTEKRTRDGEPEGNIPA